MLFRSDAGATAARRQLALAIVEARNLPADRSEAALPALTAALEAGERAAAWSPGDAVLAIRMGQASLHLAACMGVESRQPAIENAIAWFERARRASPLGTGHPRIESAK